MTRQAKPKKRKPCQSYLKSRRYYGDAQEIIDYVEKVKQAVDNIVQPNSFYVAGIDWAENK